MHNIYFWLVKKTEADTSEEAKIVFKNFLEENWFTYEWFYSNWRADWFVIGGRWSWILKDLEEWTELFSQSDNRYRYNDLGESDDAMLLNKKLYDNIKKRYKELADSFSDDDILIVNTYDLEEYPLDEMPEKDSNGDTLVDNYYIIVVDYHS